MSAQEELRRFLEDLLPELASPAQERFLRARAERLLTRVIAEASASVVSAVVDVSTGLGHPRGCTCGDELDEFIRAATSAAARNHEM